MNRGFASRAQTLADLPRLAALRFGNKAALHSNSRTFSFEDLERRISACATGLGELGLHPGDRVVVHLPNTWEWIVAYYGIARVGCVSVPANILLVSEEVQFIADDCAAVAVIAAAARIAPLRAAQRTPRELKYIGVRFDSVATSQFTDFDDLLRRAPFESKDTPAPDDVATIGYTSGTTGRPKGAVLTHHAIVLNTAMTATMHVRTSADRVVTALPCSHVYGNVVMNGAFLCGYSLVLLERFDAQAALEAVELYRATLFEGVPTMYYYLLGEESLGRRDLRSLTRATVGGQTMPKSHMRDVQSKLGCPLLELWGMTEIAGLGTTHPLYGPEKLGSIGIALPLSECRIGDLHDPDKTVPPGAAGELLIRGPTVMQAYYGRSDATREVLREGGWLSTGDVAYRDADNYLYIVDRIKEMIITAGYNIYPSEIERVIADHPAVQIVAVGAIPDTAKGELAHAFVILKQGAGLDETELLAHCRAQLAAYKVPKAIHFVTDLPKTSTGKIMRRALHTLDFPGASRPIAQRKTS